MFDRKLGNHSEIQIKAYERKRNPFTTQFQFPILCIFGK